MDAYIARQIILQWKIGTIHDSFGIDIHRTSLLVDYCNSLFNAHILGSKSCYIDKIHIDKTYSIFIIL
jgi:hypothetical protein